MIKFEIPGVDFGKHSHKYQDLVRRYGGKIAVVTELDRIKVAEVTLPGTGPGIGDPSFVRSCEERGQDPLETAFWVTVVDPKAGLLKPPPLKPYKVS